MLTFASGARLRIRDEEWLVRRVDLSSDGGHLLSCEGVSDLVRGKSSLFLTKLIAGSEPSSPTALARVTPTAPAK
jgi:hypothetical protein